VKRGIIQTLCTTATTICQEQQNLSCETDNHKQHLQLNAYPQKLKNTVTNNSKGGNRSTNEVKPIGSEFVPYVNGISEKFKRTGNHYKTFSRRPFERQSSRIIIAQHAFEDDHQIGWNKVIIL
jgi:hypothetical protein